MSLTVNNHSFSATLSYDNHDDQVIIAQCTPKGSGALALLRISGMRALEVATTISKLPAQKKLSAQSSHTIHYGWVVDSCGNHIDQVMFLVMHAPKTFTGQDVVEITCHNNPFIIERIIQQALANGARLADQGEFTRRAVLNNKIDLIQAEAINELIHANTQVALKKSLAQLEGSLSQWLQTIEQDLIKALALSEASFEFIDEENMEFGNQINTIINTTLETIKNLKKNFDQQQQIRQGVKIALIGSVNAGKSSLFNALLNKERAIVTNIAGTTRDSIEAGLYKDGNYWTLVDTAGLRQTDNTIEQQGIKRSHSQAHQADIILLVCDSSRTMQEKELLLYKELLKNYHHKIIIVKTKIDLPSQENKQENKLDAKKECISVSNKQQETIIALEKAVQAKIAQLFKQSESPFLLNQRQFNLLLTLEKKLHTIQVLLENSSIEYEILSHHLNDATAHIAQLTGKSVSEKGMDAVFREFCVGK